MDRSPYNQDDPELNYLFWKDEILQVMYWMHGEELGSQVSAAQLAALLTASEEELGAHLMQLTNERLLTKTADTNSLSLYKLSEEGKKHAGKVFRNAFEGLQKAGHGECGPDCEICYGSDGNKLDNCVHHCGESNVHKQNH
jgi:hypothetical protein